MTIIRTEVPRSLPHYSRAAWGVYQTMYARHSRDTQRSKLIPITARQGVLLPARKEAPPGWFHICHLRALVNQWRHDYSSMTLDNTTFGRHGKIRCTEPRWPAEPAARLPVWRDTTSYDVRIEELCVYNRQMAQNMMWEFAMENKATETKCKDCGKEVDKTVKAATLAQHYLRSIE